MTGQTIWPDKFGVSFHACVGRLYKHRRIISDAQTYEYSPEADQGQGHTLSFRDELKMADDLAILARKDHHGTISAVTLKEAEDGLVVVLASNEAPRRDIVRGLGALFNIISAISTEGLFY